MKNGKILTIIAAVIALIGIALFVRVSMIDADDAKALDGAISPLVSYTYYLLIIVTVVTVVLSLWNLIKNPDNLKKALLGVVTLGVLFAVSYFVLADANAVVDAQGAVLEGGEANGATNKLVGAGIWFSVILGAIGGFGFIVDLLKGFVKS